MAAAPWIVSEELWELVEPLLPKKVRRFRWVVERTFAWLHHFKRLLVRYDRRAEIHEAFLALGCCLVCFRRLRNSL